MPVIASQLIAKVGTEGVETTEHQLESVGRKSDETRGHFDLLKGALSFAAGQALFTGISDGFGFLKDQLGAVFKESSDAADELAQTNQVLKSTHDVSGMTTQSILDMSASMSHLTKFTDDQVQVGENMLLTFTNIGKNVFPQATQTMLDMSQALGQDVTSSAIQLGKALGEPLTGMTALQRVGVTFDDTQKKLIKTYMEHNEVAKAQGVILKELQKEFGGSAEAAGKTAAGQWAIFNQSLDDVRQTIGDALMPVLTKMMSFVETTALPLLGQFGDWFAKTAVPALKPFTDLLGQMADGFRTVFEPAQQTADAIKHAVDAITPMHDSVDGITKIFAQANTAIKPLHDSVSGLTGEFNQAKVAIAPLHDSVDGISKIYAGQLQPAIKNTTQAINPFVGIFQNVVKVFKEDLIPIGVKLTDWVVKVALPNLLDLGNWFLKTAVPAIKETADAILTKLLPPLGDLITNVLHLGEHLTEWLQNSGALRDAISTVSQVLGTLVGWVATFVGWLDQGNPLAWILVGAIGGIALAIEGVKLADWIYGWKSLGDTFKDLAANLMPNYTEAMKKTKKAADETKTSVKSIATEATSTKEVVTTETAVMEEDIATVGATAETTATDVTAIGTEATTSADVVATESATMEADLEAVGVSATTAAGEEGIGAIGPAATEAAATVDTETVAMGASFTRMVPVIGLAAGAVILLWQGVSSSIDSSINGMIAKVNEAAKAAGLSLKEWMPNQPETIDQYLTRTNTSLPTQGDHRGYHQYASGTSFAPGGLSLLGEGNEPEIVMGPTVGNLARGSQVIPFSQLRGGGDSAPIIHIHPPDLYLDGTRLTHAQLPYLANALRAGLGVIGQ